MQSPIHHEPADVVDRLAFLGLSVDILREAVAMGDAARNSCTANDPAITPGFLAWSRTIRGLRELLTEAGWRRCSVGGLETVVSPNGKIAIAVATGDEATGHAVGGPKTKYVRGPATVAVVAQNQQLLLPFAGTEEPAVPSLAPTDRVTWLLLIASGVDDVRCELSLPESIGADGRVELWSERIVLAPVARDGEPDVTPADQEPDVLVEVTRRAV